MDEKSRLLTIGQFAALHGINKKTLMWYDEIGLFKPAAVNPENGYRCYNYHQSSLLETILLLRELNVSIKEIQAFMENRSAESLKRLLDEKIEELDREILHLKAVRKTLGNHRQNMKTLLNTNLSEIRIVEKEERFLVTVAIDPGTSYDKTVERITAETRKYQLRRLHDASYGSMIRVENLYQSRFDDYDGLFIEIPLPLPAKPDNDSLPAHGTQKAGLHIQPRGKYVRAFYRGDWENMSLKYREILNYAQKHRLTLTGFSYEKILNENVADRMEDYIVQIEIPVLL